jgi:hypothetical protein
MRKTYPFSRTIIVITTNHLAVTDALTKAVQRFVPSLSRFRIGMRRLLWLGRLGLGRRLGLTSRGGCTGWVPVCVLDWLALESRTWWGHDWLWGVFHPGRGKQRVSKRKRRHERSLCRLTFY